MYEGSEVFVNCLKENVKEEVYFGTAGYRPFHSAESLLFLLGGNEKEYGRYLSSQEESDLFRYIECCRKDRSFEEINDDVVALMGHSLASTLKHYPDVDSVIVNYDVRLKGRDYALILIAALTPLVEKGLLSEIILIDEHMSTPELSFLMLSRYPKSWGIHLTASHNPFWFCGIKIESCLGQVASVTITQLIEENYKKCYQNMKLEGGYYLSSPVYSVRKREDFFSAYLSYLESELKVIFPWFSFKSLGCKLKNKKFPIIVDLNWGEGIYFWEKVQEIMGLTQGDILSLRNVELSGTPEGSFCFQKPEPSYATLVGRYQGQEMPFYVISHDPDADRFTVLQKKEDQDDYEELTADKWALILIGKLVEKVKLGEFKGKRIVIATTISSCTVAMYYLRLYEELLDKEGIEVRLVDQLPVGFKWFSLTPQTSQTDFGEDLLSRQSSEDFHFVYEESGGISTRLYEKDGLLGGIMTLCMIAELGDLLQYDQVLKDELPCRLSYAKTSFNYSVSVSLPSGELMNWVQTEICEFSEFRGAFYMMWKSLLMKASYEIVSICYQEGVRIALLDLKTQKEAWLTWRLSGTEPKMRLYMQVVQDCESQNCDVQSLIATFKLEILNFLETYFSQKYKGKG